MKSTDNYQRMTETPILKLVISLSIPTVISMLVTNIYNLADTAFVGQLGNSASGAVGIVFGFMSILQAIGFLFGQGGGSILSRKLGAKEDEAATKFASTAFFGALFVAIIVEIICFIFIDDLVRILGSTPTIMPYAKTYITYILLGSPFIVTSFTMNNILRYEGKASLGMVGLVAGSIINIVGDPILMFTFNMGIAGAGLSTCLSQIISFLILLSMFIRGKTSVRLSIKNISFGFKDYSDIFTTGFPSLLRQALNSFATIALNFFAKVYGDAAIAAMSIVSRLVFFVVSVGL